LGTQELTVKYEKKLTNFLPNYKFYGNYRYGNLFKNLPYNESNSIITKYHVLENKTIWLPWIAKNLKDLKNSITKMSIMPRIATILVFEDLERNQICMINTHLDYQTTSIQIRQLEVLKKVIAQYSLSYDVILTGDFNMEIGNKILDSFIDDMKNSMQHVDVPGSTWHGKHGEEATVDHIFIPNNWKVENAKVISLKGISDHDAIYANIRKK